MKSKGWKLNPHWVMREEQKAHFECMRRMQEKALLTHEDYVRSQEQIARSLETIEGQKSTSTAH